MATFLIAHGGWSAGWVWKKMRPLMQQRGHAFFTPTYTGIGERRHLANPDIDLSTHVADLQGVIEYEGLENIILVGHSYGGMVATQLADSMSEKVAELVYLDAFAPRDGQSLFDLQTDEVRTRMQAATREVGDGWQVPPNPSPPDTSPEDLAWVSGKRVPQPIRTFQERVRLTGAVDRIHRTYIYATTPPPGNLFKQFADRARSEEGWRYLEIGASHNPHVTIPVTLADMFDDIAQDVDMRNKTAKGATT
ncbi:MAG: alpha/beta hydrolase [Pseudomonadota bacterium]